MFTKGVWIALVVVGFGVMVIDRYNFLLGATICGIISYILTSSAIKWWLIGIYVKFRNTPIKQLRNRRKKIVTISSGFLLPAVEKVLAVLKSKNAPHFAENRHSEAQDFKPDACDSEHTDSGKFCCGLSPCRTEELKIFVQNILSDFVSSWYQDISGNPDFTVDVEYVLEETLGRACDKISRLNLDHLFHQLLILCHNHIIVNTRLLRKQRRAQLTNLFQEFETHSDTYSETGTVLADVHIALKDSRSENWYLTNVCDILMDLLGMEEVLQCPIVHMAIRDLLAQNMFHPLVSLISDPVWVFWGICCIFGDVDSVSSSISSVDGNPGDSNVVSNEVKNSRNQSVSTRSQPQGRESLHKRSVSCGSLSDVANGYVIHNDSDESCSMTFVKAKMNTSCSSDPLLMSAADLEISDSKPDTSLPVLSTSLKEKNLLAEGDFLSPVVKVPGLKHSHSLDSALSKSADNVSSGSKKRNLLSPKSASLPRASSSADVEQALEVIEGAYDSFRLFGNIAIVGAEAHFDTKRHNYTLYCIEYDILSRLTCGSEDGEYYTKKTGIVWRRFKEFMALQERLEGHPELKKYLKGVKGPTKWLAAPFAKLDKKNIEARRLFLQEYLRRLCNHSELAHSHELQQFLAYRGDASIAFVKKAPELHVPRLDRAVLRGLMGALDLIKTALPHLPPEMPSMDQLSNGEKTSSMRSLLPGFRKNRYDCKDLEIDFVYKEEGEPLEQMLYNHLDRMLTSSPDDSVPNSPVTNYSEMGRMHPWKRAVGFLHSVPQGYRSDGDGCDSEELGHKKLELDQMKIDKLQEAVGKEIPLADAVFDLVLQLLPPTRFVSDDSFVLSLKIVFGQVLQRWLQKLLVIDEGSLVKCLHLIHEALWPQGSSKTRNDSADLLAKYHTTALTILSSISSGILDKIYVASEIDESLNLWLDCLANPEQNRSLVYQMMDVVVDMLCAQELQRNPL